MLHIREVLVVEGKHDAVKLAAVTDAVVVVTNGFQIFKDRERLTFLRALAKSRGCVLLTDSDSAGFVIRNYLTGALPGVVVKHAFIPAVAGKEKRKHVPGKEGLLGVEGMDEATLERVLLAAGVTVTDGEKTDGSFDAASLEKPAFLTKARMMKDGLSGTADASARRVAFLKRFGLPPRLSSARLMEFVNLTLTQEEYLAALEEIT